VILASWRSLLRWRFWASRLKKGFTGSSRPEPVPPSRRKPEPCAGGRGSGRERSLSLGGAQGYIPSPQVPGREGIHELGSSAQALQHMLEESASLLTMFWRAALPSSPGPALSGSTGQSMKRELLELRTKLSKQESLLQSTVERLKTANQQKESMEQFIFSQLTRTHDVLKKARTNLEVKSLRALPCTPVV